MNPQRFIQTSDFATRKNDSPPTEVTLNLTNGQSFDPTSSGVIATTDVVIGTRNSGIRARSKQQKYSYWVVGTLLFGFIDVEIPSVGSGVFPMPVYLIVDRISPSTINVRIEAGSTAPYEHFIREDQQFTTWLTTSLSPFES